MSSSTVVRTHVARVFEACASEIEIMGEKLADLETALLGGLLEAGRVRSDAALQSALQDLDSMGQHLRALHAVLSGAASHETDDGQIAIRDTVARVTLSAVASRMATVMALEGVADTPEAHDGFELL